MNLDFLPQTAFVFMTIFARLGAMMMVLPVIGENSVPQRIRLVFALAVTLIMYPVVFQSLPPLPEELPAMLWLLVSELLVGLAIGLVVRLVMSVTQFAGTLIAFQTGLAFAQNVDPTQGIQSALFASFLSVFAVTMILVTDLHYLLIAALNDSYTLFRPGAPLPVGDFSEMAMRTVSAAFRVAVQVAAPFLAFGLLFYLGIGVLSRLMPQVQIFFLAMPVNILLGLMLFALLLGAIIMWFLAHFEDSVRAFVL